jgi:hypothetical protein
MSSTSSKTEEPKEALPAGHPAAGYVSPDQSFEDGVGTRPDDEQKAFDEQKKAREDELKGIADAEDKVAKQERKDREDELAKLQAKDDTSTSKTSSASSTSKSSS